ncbi:GAF and ANTAR domain-containing protein [Arthrobacter sp. H20]|uniref:GAF and ANTAR domain-containing protein n=1 Tax=Arthrobacter sp. H20 TaxID=1267981 RepID=UPI00047A6424|nr:GAF and ANTAR domain-containing protein [Arthrobacter sp. H20]
MVERAPSSTDSNHWDLCYPFLEELPVTGAAISIVGGSIQETVAYSDEVARTLDELQFELGEGPRWEAIASRLPVLIPDTGDDWDSRCPIFGAAVRRTPAKAMFVFPLTLGALDIGVVELYRTSPGKLSGTAQSVASALTERTSWTLLRRILAQDPDHEHSLGGVEGPSLSRREIHQATGMVLAQANVTATNALLLLRGHSFSESRSLREVAIDVIERRVNFAPLPPRAE